MIAEFNFYVAVIMLSMSIFLLLGLGLVFSAIGSLICFLGVVMLSSDNSDS